MAVKFTVIIFLVLEHAIYTHIINYFLSRDVNTMFYMHLKKWKDNVKNNILVFETKLDAITHYTKDSS